MAEKTLPLKDPRGDFSTPRALLEKGSPVWCYRTLDRLRWAFQQKTISDTEFDSLVGELDRFQAWTKIPEDHPYGSREAMLKAEIGLTIEEARARVQAIAEEAKPVSNKGGQSGNQNAAKVKELAETVDSHLCLEEKNECSDRTFVRGDGQRKYLTARIARDRPDILERMKAGEFLTVRSAAIVAGIITPRITILTVPRLAASQIRRHFSPEAIAELIRLLSEPPPEAEP